ncbi:MAG: hypothetical protein WCX73_00015 [Candidatus Pacearchaeota archaeon]|jgi:hypothetical protein
MIRINKNYKKEKVIILSLIGLGLLIILPSLISAVLYNEDYTTNASMYDILIYFKNTGCQVITNENIVDLPNYAQFYNKFNFGNNQNCFVVLDIYPYEIQQSSDFAFTKPFYAEAEYYVDALDYLDQSNKEYLFFLAKNLSAMNDLLNVTINYEKYSLLLNNTGSYLDLSENPLAWIPSFETDYLYTNCISKVNATIYTGNNLSFLDKSINKYYNFSSYCSDENTLAYGYCSYGFFMFDLVTCNCLEGKCIPKNSEIFDWISFYDFSVNIKYDADEYEDNFYWYSYSFYDKIGNIFVDDNLIKSVIKSWIES